MCAHHRGTDIPDFAPVHSRISPTDNIRFLLKASQGDSIELERLLQEGIDVNIRSQSEYSETALINACDEGHKDAVAILLQYHADVNLCASTGYTALMFATLRGHADIVNALVEHGAHIDTIAQNGFNALRLAKVRGFPVIFDYLATVQTQRSTLHALLTADKFAPAPEGYPAFPPELVDRVLRPLIKASLEENQQ